MNCTPKNSKPMELSEILDMERLRTKKPDPNYHLLCLSKNCDNAVLVYQPVGRISDKVDAWKCPECKTLLFYDRIMENIREHKIALKRKV